MNRRRRGNDELVSVDREDRSRIVVPQHPAEVSVAGGMTIGQPDFSALRVDVRVTIPCKPTEKAIEEAYEFCSDLVDDYLEREKDIALGLEEDDNG